MTSSAIASRRELRLVAGDVRASRAPAMLRTLLGSCVSACLWDPRTRIGGMNHYMLPGGCTGGGEPGRCGQSAMELLLDGMEKLGAGRNRIQGKIFGGGEMTGIASVVSQRNVEFIERFMREREIPVIARDLGGTQPRQVIFLTDTGQAFVKKGDGRRQREELDEEARDLARLAAAYGGVRALLEKMATANAKLKGAT